MFLIHCKILLARESDKILLLAVLMPIFTGKNDAVDQLRCGDRPLAKNGVWGTCCVHRDPGNGSWNNRGGSKNRVAALIFLAGLLKYNSLEEG